MAKYDDMAKQVVDLVGGSDNVLCISHCMTRLRFKLKDDTLPKTEEIEGLPKVVQVINANGQYQVVVGINVIEDLYDAVQKVTGIDGLGEVTEDGVPVGKRNPVAVVIDLISGIDRKSVV